MNDFLNKELFTEIYYAIWGWVTAEFLGLLILLLLFFVALKLVKYIIRRLKTKLVNRADKNTDVDTFEAVKRINTLTGITYGFFKVVLWVVFIMMILQKFGVNIAPLLASAGIMGLAIGFGAQELVRDYISGFFIILEDQVRTGDVALINGTGGLVEKIELRTITLRDFAGTVHVFQNGKISSLSNMTKEWSAIVFDIGVAYKEDVQKVMDIMQEVGDQLREDPEFKEEIIEPLEVFGLNEFADSALVIKARFKTKPIHQWRIGREYRKRLKVAFDNNNIEIPFPHTTVYWGDVINPLQIDVNKKS